jgi:predicted nucleotidyltransferase
MERERLEAIRAAVLAHASLSLLVLHGSRARGEETNVSDWDFAFLGDAGLDRLALAADLGDVLATDRIDLTDLARAGGLLRYRVARDGVVVVERDAGAFDRFWLSAVDFYCDAGPVLRAGWEGALAGLDR